MELKIDTDKLGDVAKEVTKAVDVSKVAKAATKDGKIDLKGAAEAVSKEVTKEEASSIANAAKKLIK